VHGVGREENKERRNGGKYKQGKWKKEMNKERGI
jgi:hypothetical protein